MNLDWYNLLIIRIPYNFLSQWQLTAWASLLLTLFLLVLLLRFAPPSLASFARFVRITLTATIIVSLIHLVGGEIIRSPLILQLQLLRIWLIPTYLSFIAGAWLITRLWQKHLFYKFVSIIMFVMLVTNFGKIQISPIEFPHQNLREWDTLQIWAKNNTPQDSLFLTPPHRSGFRVHSQRSIVAEIKDGSSSLYSYQLAQEWQSRIANIHPLGSKSTAEILNLKHRYNVNYLVTFADQPHPSLTEIYRNSTFVVYQLQ